jgi:D-alanyl-lipoteichoic acid acyltransferase DltB (MBOAT superfamily)
MLFTSVTFVVFFAVVFAVYWSVPIRRCQNLLLAAASYVFYAWWDPRFCGLMFAHCLVDFTIARLLDRARADRTRRALLGCSVAFNLGLLGVFKYFHFFQDNLVALAAQVGCRLEPWSVRIVLPVGISFYTFQSLGYTIDVYRRRLAPARDLIDYLAFVAFFPVLIAGPIERAVNLLPQFDRPRRFDRAGAVDGCRLVLLGFVKKLLLADTLGKFVAPYFVPEASPYASGGQLILATVCFAFQLYCDFSAYSDVALGTAQLLGFRLMRNFNQPYFAVDVADFWRRWHVSLSTWFRDYVYVPLGGNRGGRAETVRNLCVTFLLSGLWHGASWHFVVWGAFHGLGVTVCALWPRRDRAEEEGARLLPSWRQLRGMAATFAFVCVGWVFFRAESLPHAAAVLYRMASRTFARFNPAFPDLKLPLAMVACLVVLEWLQRRRPHLLTLDRFPRPFRWAAYTGLIWLTLSLQAGEAAPFIYFQF